MASLIFVRDAKETNLLLLGISEEGESARYTVNLSTYREIGAPSAGDELDGEQLAAVKYTDELLRAKKKALNILAFADNNKRTLSVKLYRAGFGREITEAVVTEMVERGYINESRQLERLILNEANVKLRGPGRIIPALVAKGFSSSDIREALSALESSGEIDFSRNARLLLEKKLSDDADEDEAKKILFKNGYKTC